MKIIEKEFNIETGEEIFTEREETSEERILREAKEKQLKKENKLYEEQWRLQQEIISRNVINDNINDPRVQFKKNRDKYKASK